MVEFWCLTQFFLNQSTGLFEGKTGSLLHPVAMLGMLALSVSTALLGFDWRRQVRKAMMD
jgi:hypothetical protein